MPSPRRKLISLTVIGRDRTGVIAGFTNLLFQEGANIEALEEQVQSGMFSMTLQASWPASRYNGTALRKKTTALAKQFGMELTLRELSARQRPRMAILATRETHCLEALLKARLPCEPCVIIGSYPDLGPLAKKAKLPFVYVPWTKRAKAEERVLKLAAQYDVDFIVLARFMRILSPNFVWRWKHRIINIHPSLLPSFPGASAYRQAYETGVRVAGVTAHFVTPNLDEGPILTQESFRIPSTWSLGQIVARGQRAESKALTDAVRLFLRHRFDVYWGKVHPRPN